MLRFSPLASVEYFKSVAKPNETRNVSFDVALFTLRLSRLTQSEENQKETRSVSEGFFAFSNQPSTRYATNTSVLLNSQKRNI